MVRKLWHVPYVVCMWQYENMREWYTSREIEAAKWRVISSLVPSEMCSVVGDSLWSLQSWLWSCGEGLFVSSIFCSGIVEGTGSDSMVWGCWSDVAGMVVSTGGCDGVWFRGVDAMEVAGPVTPSCSMSWRGAPLNSPTSCTPCKRRECKECYVFGRECMYVI